VFVSARTPMIVDFKGVPATGSVGVSSFAAPADSRLGNFGAGVDFAAGGNAAGAGAAGVALAGSSMCGGLSQFTASKGGSTGGLPVNVT
jgi:hypothetical protein